MALPIIPWEPCNFPDVVQAELNRRKIDRSFKYVTSEKGAWNNETGDWSKYRGPMSSWVRLCSNGFGSELVKKPGYVFFAGQDFYSAYGFLPTADGKRESIIGFTPEGVPHVVDYDLKTSEGPIHVPAPEIEQISVVIQKELFRRATIEWICFSPQQLEYMTPYFMTAGISCVVEWGWNHFEQSSLIDLTNMNLLRNLFDNPYPLYNKNILKSRGNYDVLFGVITGFKWRLEGNKIKCTTEITSKDRIYAGLPIDASTVGEGTEDKSEPLGNLRTFLKAAATQLKGIRDFSKYPTATANDPFDGIREFLNYIKTKPDFEETLYGVYYGRDVEDKTAPADPDRNKDKDWDGKSTGDNLWVNMGLLMEIVNFHSSRLLSPNGEPMFQVDISDVVVSGHPNLISTDGMTLLIPNAEAPKYFYGNYGDIHDYSDPEGKKYPLSTFNKEVECKSKASSKNKMSDYHLKRMCYQPGGKAYRDDLDVVINGFRHRKKKPQFPTEFPFRNDYKSEDVEASKPYPARYSGYLKNLYVHIKFLQRVADNEKTIYDFISKVLEGINDAAGNFWDFRIVNGTGKASSGDEPAMMKIVDYRFGASVNPGKVFSFEYFSADSLLLGADFNPTLSNAVAIRTMFAQNNSNKSTTLSSDGELLEGVFRDRLFQGESKKNIYKVRSSTAWIETMKSLQSVAPPTLQSAFQVTSKDPTKGEVIVKRLVLPDGDGSILKMLLDDQDMDYNPKYTGIMPGIQAQFTIQGIGGLRTFMMFLVKNLPKPYTHKNVVFRVVDLQETIGRNGQWTTTITAGVIPLRKHIKERLGLK
jgi:hypothetical protein